MIKRFIIFFVAYQFITFISNAQTTFGAKIGYTDAWPNYGDAILPESAETHISGYNISLIYQKSIGRRFSIGITPGLVQRGAACFPGWQPIFVGDTKVKMNYVESPLMLNYNLPLFEKFSLTPSLGYGVSYLISAMQVITPLDPTIAPSRSRLELKDNRLKRFDHGAYGSIKANYRIRKNGSIFLEANYYYALSNYDKVATSINRSMSYNFGYTFNLM